ncbi:MAG: acyl carrier protein [Lachnospiraceae bacterium]|nr:acyl carrier protein [Lachnospiraceae bacterium]
MKEQVIKVLEDFNDELVEDLEQDLFLSGKLDSFDLVKLVVELEDAFDISIDVEEVTVENFQSVTAIIDLMERIAK